MPLYVVSVEARGYGDPLDDAEAFIAAVGELELDELPQCAQDEGRKMLMVTFNIDSPDGRQAHDDGLELWEVAWDAAFPDMAPTAVLGVTARPQTEAEAAALPEVDEFEDADEAAAP